MCHLHHGLSKLFLVSWAFSITPSSSCWCSPLHRLLPSISSNLPSHPFPPASHFLPFSHSLCRPLSLLCSMEFSKHCEYCSTEARSEAVKEGEEGPVWAGEHHLICFCFSGKFQKRCKDGGISEEKTRTVFRWRWTFYWTWLKIRTGLGWNSSYTDVGSSVITRLVITDDLTSVI